MGRSTDKSKQMTSPFDIADLVVLACAGGVLAAVDLAFRRATHRPAAAPAAKVASSQPRAAREPQRVAA